MADYFESVVSVVDRPARITGSRGDSFWRKENPEFNSEGQLIKGGMFAHQRAFWELPNYIKVMVGGYGAGKTSIGCKRIISTALENAPAMVATVSPSYGLARKTVIETINVYCAGKRKNFGKDFWYKYNKGLHEFSIRYRGRNATILCLSGDDPDALRGPNLAAAYIDEPFIQDQAVFTQMVARVRHPEAVHKEIFLTGTPEQLGWGYDLCMGELRETNDVGMIQASTRANLALSGDYVKRLEGVLTGKSADAYIEGSFVNLSEGLVYYGFQGLGNKHVKDLERPVSCELGVGMDFNVNPMSSCVFWRSGKHMHFFDELELPNADTEYMCDELRKRYGNDLQIVYPDASGVARKTSSPGGRSDFWYIRAAGFTISAHHANPHRKDRYNAVNGKLAPKSGLPTISISPKCKKLIKYLSTYSHEEINKQEAMSHLLDSFSYPIEYLYPVNKETVIVQRLSGA